MGRSHRVRLLLLAVGVLTAHLLMLLGWPEAKRPAQPLSVRAMNTRTITTAPPQTRPQPALEADKVHQVRERSAAPAQESVTTALVAVSAESPTMHAQAAAARPASTQPTIQAKVAGSVRLHYEVVARARGLTLDGSGELLLRHDGNDYEAKLEVSAPFVPTRTQRSTGRITAQGLAPIRFSEKARNEEATHFQRDKGMISFSSNQPDAQLEPGAQDRLSVMLQLGAMMAAAPTRFPAASTIEIQTAGTRGAEEWLFTIHGAEQLKLPGGSLATLKIIRNPRREFDQKIELWLAPGMEYLPVRLRLTNPNGDWVDQQWSSTEK